MRKVLLDVDTGVDDALALIFALRSPELDVRAITTVAGNTTVNQALRNTLLLLDVLQAPAIPVARGADRPLVRPLVTAGEVHGADGLGNATTVYPPPRRGPCDQDATELILSTIASTSAAEREQLTLVATGPLTNLARALEADPATFRLLGRLVVMGGAVRTAGNTGPAAEFNFFCDPEAARAVFQAGLQVTLVPLDVSERAVLPRASLRALSQQRDSSVFQFVREFTVLWFDYHREVAGLDGGYLHDPLAVAAAALPDLLRTVHTRVSVETAGEFTAGMTVADLRGRKPGPQVLARFGGSAAQGGPYGPPNAHVAVDADVPRFLDLFYERVCR